MVRHSATLTPIAFHPICVPSLCAPNINHKRLSRVLDSTIHHPGAISSAAKVLIPEISLLGLPPVRTSLGKVSNEEDL
jgi:hypothetical protein